MIILIINLLYKVIVEILLENKKSDNNGSNYGQLSQFFVGSLGATAIRFGKFLKEVGIRGSCRNWCRNQLY